MKLDRHQRALIEHRSGHTLGLAGAGSGKAACIAERVVSAIAVDGVPPFSVLAVTFTNKGTAEMRERIDQRLEAIGYGQIDWGDPRRRPLVTTRRKLARLILTTCPVECRVAPRFTILDAEQSTRWLRHIAEDLLRTSDPLVQISDYRPPPPQRSPRFGFLRQPAR